MRDQPWEVPPDVESELVVLGRSSRDNGSAPVEFDNEAVRECAAIDPEEWFALSNWAKQTANLQPWQRKLSFDIGMRTKRGRPPSAKQAEYGRRILDEARRLGFRG